MLQAGRRRSGRPRFLGRGRRRLRPHRMALAGATLGGLVCRLLGVLAAALRGDGLADATGRQA